MNALQKELRRKKEERAAERARTAAACASEDMPPGVDSSDFKGHALFF